MSDVAAREGQTHCGRHLRKMSDCSGVRPPGRGGLMRLNVIGIELGNVKVGVLEMDMRQKWPKLS